LNGGDSSVMGLEQGEDSNEEKFVAILS
jgi:hypothetical protein